ncbi:hypothetical protein D3C72_1906330 [compost metagenome]
MHCHKAPAADVAAARVDHRLRVTHSHGCVYGITAQLQDIDADLRGQMLRCHYHAVFGFDRRIGCGIQAAADQQRRHGQRLAPFL